MRTLTLIAILALTLLTRAPWMLGDVSGEERAHAGAAHQFVIRREQAPPPLRLDPPAASHLGSPVLWSLRAPAPEYDDRGPPDQLGWIALRDTSLPTGEFVAPWIVSALMRLPFVLLHLVAVYLLFRLAERFYGCAAGAVAAGIVATAAAPALAGATATPTALALPATVLLLVALDDFVRAAGYDGRPPPSLLRGRTLALGGAAGLCAGVSYALLPVVGAGVVWLAGRRGALERREERCQPPSIVRRVIGCAVAAVVVWGLYAGDVARLDVADMTLPAPLWWAGALDAVRDAVAVSFAERLAAPWSVGGPTLVAVGALGLFAWPSLRRDRADTPSLLLTIGLSAVAAALLVAPRHVPVALAAALPPFAILAGAWFVRLARHARVVGAAAAVLLLAGLALGWTTVAPWAPPPVPTAAAAQPRMTQDEDWLLDRFIATRSPGRVVTVLGRGPLLRATAGSVIEEVHARDTRIAATWRRIANGDDVVLVIGDFGAGAGIIPREEVRPPDARFLRIRVYGRR